MKHIIPIIALSLWASAAAAQLKTDTVSLWTLTRNSAALTSVSHKMSDANVFVGTQQGKMHSNSEGKQMWNYGAEASSLYRISNQTVVAGGISYTRKEGKQMGGQVLVSPDDAPFSITEYDDETRGKKAMDQYILCGSIGTDVGKGFSLGAAVDYWAANYAKRKDPRHKNSFMQLVVSPSIAWNVLANSHGINGKRLTLGACYTYRRTIESLSFRMYGRQDKVEHYLVDFGAYYGIDEQADGSGFTDPSNEKPIYDEQHSLSAQIEYQPTAGRSLFLSVEAGNRHGHYGEKSPNLLSMTEHCGKMGNLLLGYGLKTNNVRSVSTFMATYGELDNYLRVSRSVSGEGGITDVVYYGKSKAGYRETMAFSLRNETFFGSSVLQTTGKETVISRHPYHILLDIGCNTTDRQAIVYPHYRKQKLTAWTVDAGVERTLLLRHTMFSIGVSPFISFGNSSLSDNLYISDFEETTPPASADLYLDRETEFLTSTRLGFAASMKFERVVSKNIVGYVKADYSWLHGFDMKAIEGSNRHQMQITLGCSF